MALERKTQSPSVSLPLSQRPGEQRNAAMLTLHGQQCSPRRASSSLIAGLRDWLPQRDLGLRFSQSLFFTSRCAPPPNAAA